MALGNKGMCDQAVFDLLSSGYSTLFDPAVAAPQVTGSSGSTTKWDAPPILFWKGSLCEGQLNFLERDQLDHYKSELKSTKNDFDEGWTACYVPLGAQGRVSNDTNYTDGPHLFVMGTTAQHPISVRPIHVNQSNGVPVSSDKDYALTSQDVPLSWDHYRVETCMDRIKLSLGGRDVDVSDEKCDAIMSKVHPRTDRTRAVLSAGNVTQSRLDFSCYDNLSNPIGLQEGDRGYQFADDLPVTCFNRDCADFGYKSAAMRANTCAPAICSDHIETSGHFDGTEPQIYCGGVEDFSFPPKLPTGAKDFPLSTEIPKAQQDADDHENGLATWGWGLFAGGILLFALVVFLLIGFL